MIPRVLLWILFAIMVHVYTSNAFVIPQKSRPAPLPTMHDTWQHLPKVVVAAAREEDRSSLTTTTTTTTTLAMLGGEESSVLLSAAEQNLSFLRNANVWIFLVGLVPFGWATIEFWRRIAVGEPFGTSSDSVYIGKDSAPNESRGRRVLDRGAFVVAYILFGIAATAIGITLYSVVTSPPMMDTTVQVVVQ